MCRTVCSLWACAAPVSSPVDLTGLRGHRLTTADLWSWFPDFLTLRRGRVARGGAIGRGTALQTGTSRVRFLMVSLKFFIDIILPVDSASNRNEYQEYFLGVKAAGA
jgi:hypothetical protein